MTELGLNTIPLLVELGRLGRAIDPTTVDHATLLEHLDQHMAVLRKSHLDTDDDT